MENASSIVRFVLDERIVEIDLESSGKYSPTTTVLNYLRSLLNHKGVKEGCAEGDCGACTVVLANLNEAGKMEYHAFDSCLIFLPMIHGKQLITVENLGSSENMHPVQLAMVETDGSQCGFCTPGFVMSLFSIFKNHNNPGQEIIDDALTGNLCRCTGYRSIVEAAAKACVQNGKDFFSKRENKIAELLKEIKSSKKHLEIVTGDQEYFQPQILKDALELKANNPEATLICGATDIALRVTKNNETISKIIDLGEIEALQKIVRTQNGLQIGAGVSLEKLKVACKNTFPALFDMLSVFGSLQIRNLATLGGNLGSASPIGDTPPVLMAYDAKVELMSAAATRTFSIRDFITGYRQTQIQPSEIISAIEIPFPAKNVTVKSYKISKRKDLDISTVSAGFRLELDENECVKDICLAFGGMAAMTKRATKAEEFLKNKEWNREIIEAAKEFIDKEFTPISDARASAAGRQVMARNLLMKFWTETVREPELTLA